MELHHLRTRRCPVCKGMGKIVRWEPVHRNNHWLDATMLACVAGNMAGVRLMQDGGDRPHPRVVTNWFAQQTRHR